MQPILLILAAALCAPAAPVLAQPDPAAITREEAERLAPPALARRIAPAAPADNIVAARVMPSSELTPLGWIDLVQLFEKPEVLAPGVCRSTVHSVDFEDVASSQLFDRNNPIRPTSRGSDIWVRLADPGAVTGPQPAEEVACPLDVAGYAVVRDASPEDAAQALRLLQDAKASARKRRLPAGFQGCRDEAGTRECVSPIRALADLPLDLITGIRLTDEEQCPRGQARRGCIDIHFDMSGRLCAAWAARVDFRTEPTGQLHLRRQYSCHH